MRSKWIAKIQMTNAFGIQIPTVPNIIKNKIPLYQQWLVSVIQLCSTKP